MTQRRLWLSERAKSRAWRCIQRCVVFHAIVKKTYILTGKSLSALSHTESEHMLAAPCHMACPSSYVCSYFMLHASSSVAWCTELNLVISLRDQQTTVSVHWAAYAICESSSPGAARWCRLASEESAAVIKGRAARASPHGRSPPFCAEGRDSCTPGTRKGPRLR